MIGEQYEISSILRRIQKEQGWWCLWWIVSVYVCHSVCKVQPWRTDTDHHLLLLGGWKGEGNGKKDWIGDDNVWYFFSYIHIHIYTYIYHHHQLWNTSSLTDREENESFRSETDRHYGLHNHWTERKKEKGERKKLPKEVVTNILCLQCVVSVWCTRSNNLLLHHQPLTLCYTHEWTQNLLEVVQEKTPLLPSTPVTASSLSTN